MILFQIILIVQAPNERSCQSLRIYSKIPKLEKLRYKKLQRGSKEAFGWEATSVWWGKLRNLGILRVLKSAFQPRRVETRKSTRVASCERFCLISKPHSQTKRFTTLEKEIDDVSTHPAQIPSRSQQQFFSVEW